MALSGGIAMGEFAPRWSDVDVCIWVRGPLTSSEEERVERVRIGMVETFLEGRAGGWASGQVIEPTFLPIEGAGLPRQPGQNPFDRLVLSRHGRVLWGEAVAVSPPPRDLLERQLREDLERLGALSPRLDRPIWLTDMILWIGRSIVFWRDGELMGKSAALELEIAAGSPFSESYGFALRRRSEGSASCARHLPEARTHFLSISAPAADILSRALE